MGQTRVTIYIRDEDMRQRFAERNTKRIWRVGVDLGQSQDPTAICVLETIKEPILTIGAPMPIPPQWKTTHRVRHLERLALEMT